MYLWRVFIYAFNYVFILILFLLIDFENIMIHIHSRTHSIRVGLVNGLRSNKKINSKLYSVGNLVLYTLKIVTKYKYLMLIDKNYFKAVIIYVF